MRSFFYYKISVFILISCSISVSAQISENFAEWTDKEIIPVTDNFVQYDKYKWYPLGIASILLTATQDDYIRSDMKDHQNINSELSKWGDILGSGAGSLAVIGAQWAFDNDTSNAYSHLRGFVWGGVSIYAFKTVFNRKRPGESRNYQSFPSGHTAISFMTASQINQAYGWKWGAPAYFVASFIGATRLSDDAHWASDVVAGALLGTLIGYSTFNSKQSTLNSEGDQKETHKVNESYLIPNISFDPKNTYLQMTWISTFQAF